MSEPTFQERISTMSIDDLVSRIDERTKQITALGSQIETLQLEVTMLKGQLSNSIQSINTTYFPEEPTTEEVLEETYGDSEEAPWDGWADSGNGHEVPEAT